MSNNSLLLIFNTKNLSYTHNYRSLIDFSIKFYIINVLSFFDKLTINLDSYELIVDGKKVDCPPKEMELLYHLASSPNRVFTRNQLLDEVWGFDYFGDSRTVDVHVKRLREKLEGVSDQWSLKTVWGVGYKFEVAE
jgi:DNA-binding response OmpR family regulator